MVSLNGVDAVAVADTRCGISQLSEDFVDRLGVVRNPWSGPMVTVVSRDTFSIGEKALVSVELLDKGLNGRCGIIRDNMFDVLLSMDFLSKLGFVVDVENLLLVNPEVGVPQSAPMFMIERFVQYPTEKPATGPFGPFKEEGVHGRPGED